MVSPQNPTLEPSSVARTDRGFVPETSTSTYSYSSSPAHFGGHYFWGSVIAGTLLAISIGMLSWALMFGCHVGTYSNGAISYGWGAAIWIVVTSCIAYFFGGMFSGCLSSHRGDGWLHGVGVWGLSVPLLMCLIAFISGSAGLAYGPASRVTETIVNQTGTAQLFHGDLFVNFGGAWTVFIALICGLFFAMVGGYFSRSYNFSKTTASYETH